MYKHIRRGGAVVAAAAALGVTTDAAAKDSPWSVRVEGPMTAQELRLPAQASPARLAEAAIINSAGDLGVKGRLGRLEAAGSIGDPQGRMRVIRYRQAVGGLRVLWSQLNVTVGQGSVAGIMGTVVPLPSEKVRGAVKIRAKRATEIARRRIPGRDTAHKPQLVAYAGEPEKPRAPRRAYVVEVTPAKTGAGDHTSRSLCVVIDAASGKVLKVWEGSAAKPPLSREPRARASATTTVLAQYVDAKGTSATTGTALFSNWYDLVANGNGYRYDIDGASFKAFGNPTPLNSGSPPFRTAADTTTEVARYFCLTRRYCGRDSGLDGSYNRIFFTINWGGSTAMFKTDQDRIYIPRDDSRNWETAAHEMGHLIDYHFRDDYIDTFEGHEVEEALAEMFNYDFSRERPTPPGELVSISRLLQDPSSAGVTVGGFIPPNHYTGYNCTAADEHVNGYILGHAYWKLVQRLGHQTAGEILQYVPWQLPARREFGDLREALEDAAHGLFPGPNGSEGAVEQHVDDVFNEVGVQDVSRRTDRCPGANA